MTIHNWHNPGRRSKEIPSHLVGNSANKVQRTVKLFLKREDDKLLTLEMTEEEGREAIRFLQRSLEVLDGSR